MLAIFQKLATDDRANTGRQHDLTIGYDKVGNLLARTGDVAAALQTYRDGLAVAERLVAGDPGNARWQRALAISHERIGDIQLAHGDPTNALPSFRNSLAIRDNLAKRDPSNTGWQRDLSIVHNKVGDALAAQGLLTQALTSYRASLAIRVALTRADPRNAQWRTDLQVSAERLGVLSYKLVLTRDFDDALAAVDEAIGVAPDKLWLQANRAHALMFLRRDDEARALYLKYRGRKDVYDGKSWDEAITRDFSEFRRAGLTTPLMGEVENAGRNERPAPG
jgi:tetratricopeptide (TPR) repeat protein